MYAGLGIILIVTGAIAAFAVRDSVDAVDLYAVGLILMAGGGLSLLVAAIRAAGWMSMSSSRTRTERHVSGDGRHVVEESRAE